MSGAYRMEASGEYLPCDSIFALIGPQIPRSILLSCQGRIEPMNARALLLTAFMRFP
jgi:hypothetical protein